MLDTCLWSAFQARADVTAAQLVAAAKVTVPAAVQLTVQVEDAHELLEAAVQQHKTDLLVGIWTSASPTVPLQTTYLPLSSVKQSATGRTYQGNVPFAQQFRLSVASPSVQLAPADSSIGQISSFGPGLRSMAARYLFLDEVDAYPGDVEGEGDPITLAMARTRTFARRKVFLVSTPKITGMSRIESAYEESDQRKYWVPCPTCRELQILKFAQLRWPKGDPQSAVYVCEHCGQEIRNHQKHSMLARGEWRAGAKGDGRTAGFHISSLYSPVGWFSWGDAAKQFEQAQRNPALLQVFVNTVLGETWTLLGEAPEWQKLYDRRESYKIGTVPPGGLFLTAGADVQKDRIEVEITAWGRGKESWSVDYRVLEGDTSRPQVWEKLTALLSETFPTASGLELQILQLAVDSGFATIEVYQWARRQGGRVLVIKGDSRTPALIGAASPVEVGPAGAKLKRGVRVWPVNSGMAKEELYRWLRLDRPTDEDLAKGIPFPPGYCHLPRYSEEYFKQITAEQLVTKIVKGYRRHEWQKMRERNEALDCRVYARAAAGRVGIDRFQEKHWTDLERRVGAPPVQEVKQPQQQQRTDGKQAPRNRVRFRMEV